MIPAWLGFSFTVIVMIITGTMNTILAKYMNTLKANGTNPSHVHLFDHPLLQTGEMFFGELLCLFAFQVLVSCTFCRKHIDNEQQERVVVDNEWDRVINDGNEHQHAVKVTPLVWSIPAFFDLVGTAMMFIGLNWTHASSFQMLRGSVIIFTGLFSMIFLKSRLLLHHFFGMILIACTLVLVGLGDYYYYHTESNKTGDYYYYDTESNKSYTYMYILISDLLIIISQIITALQVIVEEYLLKKYRTPPLKAVGLEGLFGFTMVFLAYLITYQVPWHPPTHGQSKQSHKRFEDIADAFTMLESSWQIPLVALAFVISIGVFNFAGLTVTNTRNATTRVVLDNIRTLLICVIDLSVIDRKVVHRIAAHQKEFLFLQLGGFIILVIGTNIYHKTYTHCYRWFRRPDVDPEQEEFLIVGDVGREPQNEVFARYGNM